MRLSSMTIAFATLASAGLGSTQAAAANLTACETTAAEVDRLRNAFFFAFPLYEMTRTRQMMLSIPGAEPNRLLHRKTLSGPGDRTVTTPNTDTLYSTAWLDLSGGPLELSIPPMGSRYHSVELMHAFSDAFAMLRNDGETTSTFLIVGPNWHGEEGPEQKVVRSPTRDAWLVIRTFVQSPDDLAEAQRLQTAFALTGGERLVKARPAGARIPASPDAGTFLSVVNDALARGPLPFDQQERLDCYAGVGIAPYSSGGESAFDPDLLAQWDANMPRFMEETRLAFESGGSVHDGWRYPAPNIARFGKDDLYRSAMALGGLAAMPLDEALNPVAVADAAGEPLTGESRYRLRIPWHVPVGAFWSLTLYEAGGPGRWFLYDNPISRYAINSATANLRHQTDGSIVVEISHEVPDGSINWLPAPKGKFMVVFRAYRPQPALINGSFRLPSIMRID